jgi:hypothetical protein
MRAMATDSLRFMPPDSALACVFSANGRYEHSSCQLVVSISTSNNRKYTLDTIHVT